METISRKELEREMTDIGGIALKSFYKKYNLPKSMRKIFVRMNKLARKIKGPGRGRMQVFIGIHIERKKRRWERESKWYTGYEHDVYLRLNISPKYTKFRLMLGRQRILWTKLSHKQCRIFQENLLDVFRQMLSNLKLDPERGWIIGPKYRVSDKLKCRKIVH